MRALCFLPKASLACRNDLSVLVRSAGLQFSPCDSAEDVFRQMASTPAWKHNFVITDESQISFVQEFSAKYPSCLIILALNTQLPHLDKTLRDCLSIQCFVAANNSSSLFESHELLTILNKFRTRNIFGLEQYLRRYAMIESFGIYRPEDKKIIIEKVSDFIRQLGDNLETNRFGEYARRIAEMLDELALNAIFDANPRYVDEPRNAQFVLTEQEAVRVRWGYDGEVFGMSVMDPFGSLRKESIMNYLDGTLQQEDIHLRKSGGMGLRLVFERLHQFVVNIHPNVMTEAICLLRFERRMKDFNSKVRSFHYFTV